MNNKPQVLIVEDQKKTLADYLRTLRSEEYDLTGVRSLAEAMAKIGILKMFFLDLDNKPTATVMCFDYNGVAYLYNSGYDDRYRSLSVGLLCKVLNIKDSIERGKRKYEFLKGDERYKSKLGGKNIHLYRYRVNL